MSAVRPGGWWFDRYYVGLDSRKRDGRPATAFFRDSNGDDWSLFHLSSDDPPLEVVMEANAALLGILNKETSDD